MARELSYATLDVLLWLDQNTHRFELRQCPPQHLKDLAFIAAERLDADGFEAHADALRRAVLDDLSLGGWQIAPATMKAVHAALREHRASWLQNHGAAHLIGGE